MKKKRKSRGGISLARIWELIYAHDFTNNGRNTNEAIRTASEAVAELELELANGC